jgi:hypothetical protein
MSEFDLPRNTAIITDNYPVVIIEMINNAFSNVGIIFKELAKKYPHNKILYTFTDDKDPDRPKFIVILEKNKAE